jgi:hypothetical protein
MRPDLGDDEEGAELMGLTAGSMDCTRVAVQARIVPACQKQPTSSTLSYAAGQVIANGATIKLGTGTRTPRRTPRSRRAGAGGDRGRCAPDRGGRVPLRDLNLAVRRRRGIA